MDNNQIGLAFILVIAFLIHCPPTITGKWIGGNEIDELTQKYRKDNNYAESDEYANCPSIDGNKLNVHLVPHTHDDVGWLKTIDQYYANIQPQIYNAGVKYILDSVIDELAKDRRRKFTYVEIAYFWRWWNQQNEQRKQQVKEMVQRGQLQFTLGGWCMEDEATTHYVAIIDQMSLGLNFLRRTFEDKGRPLVAWQIDPFGHSREQASLFAQMGFDGVILGRIDYQDIEKRKNTKQMEMMWKASSTLGKEAWLFTGVLYHLYIPPDGFNYGTGDHEGWQDDPRLMDYNVDKIVKKFVETASNISKVYSSNNVILTMGGDFQYSDAHYWYAQMDKLIQYVNAADKGLNVVYSTPACYIKAVNKAKLRLSTKSDDFFPYASSAHSYWTGYFTSRPALKRYVRESSNLLQICKQLAVLSGLHQTDKLIEGELGVMKRAVGVAQHHDAVSGTEKQAVSDDYAERLWIGREECKKVIFKSLKQLAIEKQPSIVRPTQSPTTHFCDYLNISTCSITETNDNFTMAIYNPHGQSVEHWVRIPITIAKKNYSIKVTNAAGNDVEYDITTLNAATRKIKQDRNWNSSNELELVFKASLPPLGLKTYFVTKTKTSSHKMAINPIKESKPTHKKMTLENEFLRLQLDPATGYTKSLINLKSGLNVNLRQTFMFYNGMTNKNSRASTQASGAYVFRPDAQTPKPVSKTAKIRLIKGKQFIEVRQTFTDWAEQIIRLYKGARYLEVKWIIGPLPNNNTEVITRYDTDLKTTGLFYTDSNGREMLQRKRNFRPTWKLKTTEPCSQNYYPVTSRILIRDETGKNRQLNILTDRAQGGSSLIDGSVELMLHRATVEDDRFGVGEPLREPGYNGKGLIVAGTHWLFLETPDNSPKMYREWSLRKFSTPIIAFSAPSKKLSWTDNYKDNHNTDWSALSMKLPENVNLLTLEPFDDKSVLIRLEHFYEQGEDDQLSTPAKVVLDQLFPQLKIRKVIELSLAANQKKNDMRRLQWDVQDDEIESYFNKDGFLADTYTYTVVVKPMQIRTFKILLN